MAAFIFFDTLFDGPYELTEWLRMLMPLASMYCTRGQNWEASDLLTRPTRLSVDM